LIFIIGIIRYSLKLYNLILGLKTIFIEEDKLYV